MTGVELIAAERQRQMDVIGWDKDHDDGHCDSVLWHAARCYLSLKPGSTRMPAGWPWERSDFKPKSRIKNLVRAGALIAAEIDRLQREAVEVD